MSTQYEWDKHKADANIRKHGVDFADAATIFMDDFAITVADDCPDEERFVSVGMDALSRYWW